MRISASLKNAYEFACHSRACAPPPAGHGGSEKGGHVSTVGNLMARSGAIGKGPPAGWGNDPTRSGPKSAGWGTGRRTVKVSGSAGKWKSGTTYDSPKFARTAHAKATVKRSDPIAKFMGKMQKKSREDYWGPGGPPKGKDADLAKRFAVWKRET